MPDTYQFFDVKIEEIMRPEVIVEDDYYNDYESVDLYSGISMALLEDLNINLKSAGDSFDQLFDSKLKSMVDKVSVCEIEKIPCEKNLKMNLAFVVDSSVDKADFIRMKFFIKNIVKNFEIGTDFTRVSF